MKKKNIFLIAGILSLLVFVGFLSETEAKMLLGFSVSIWFYRIAWLLLTVSFLSTYFKMRKSEKNAT
jgi:hypothetical protein